MFCYFYYCCFFLDYIEREIGFCFDMFVFFIKIEVFREIYDYFFSCEVDCEGSYIR